MTVIVIAFDSGRRIVIVTTALPDALPAISDTALKAVGLSASILQDMLCADCRCSTSYGTSSRQRTH